MDSEYLPRQETKMDSTKENVTQELASNAATDENVEPATKKKKY